MASPGNVVQSAAAAEHSPALAERLLFGAAILLSSFLLFAVQPIFAKLILPWFGGSAAVWATCLVFFQTALLVGYLYAHWLAGLPRARVITAAHLALLTASLIVLPIIPSPRWRPQPGAEPAIHIVLLLTAVLGLPYLALAANSPLLQSWYLRQFPAAIPYRLFALSNAGSVLALLLYPIAIEPVLTTNRQAVIWSLLYGGFALLAAVLAWRSRVFPVLHRAALTGSAASDYAGDKTPAPTRAQQVTWVALAAASSELLLAVTTHLTQNVAPVPFLWILPLSLYLLSFIICFERPGLYQRWLFLRLLAVALGALGYALYDIHSSEALVVSVPLYSLALFVCCMFCHGELAWRRPDPVFLTRYYLMIALGGALGSMAAGLIAPYALRGTYELPLGLTLLASLATYLLWNEGWGARLLWSGVSATMIAVVVANALGNSEDALVQLRNFYGALRVTESHPPGPRQTRRLYNGTIQHGAQFATLPFRRLPTTYYGPPSGIGIVLRRFPAHPRRVGVIGLGAGTLATYGDAGDTYRFYEINPQVIDVARNVFTFTRETQAKVEFVLGDARLALEQEPPQHFHVLAIDAFSGDAIPVHLLTREAFALYLRHVEPGGVLAFHVSNRYLDLAPVVAQLARQFGLATREVVSESDPAKLLSASDWVMATRDQQFLRSPELAEEGNAVRVPARFVPWTDDYNNLFEVLKQVHWRRGDDD